MKIFSDEFNKLNDNKKMGLIMIEMDRAQKYLDKLKTASRKILSKPGFQSKIDERPDIQYDETQKE